LLASGGATYTDIKIKYNDKLNNTSNSEVKFVATKDKTLQLISELKRAKDIMDKYLDFVIIRNFQIPMNILYYNKFLIKESKNKTNDQTIQLMQGFSKISNVSFLEKFSLS